VSRFASTASQEIYIGLMSGTSLDGVDSVLVRLDSRRPIPLATAFLPYPKHLKAKLLALHEPFRDELDAAALVGIELSRHYTRAVEMVLKKSGVPAGAVRAIACHGQTIRHRPRSGYTLQLGNPAWLAERTGITVVADFRSRDIAAGGQGAPLVPAFHAACFRDSRRHRVIVNLGGIANVTDLPVRRSVTGFDAGPGNVLLDAWARERFGRDFDRRGELASRGKPVATLLKAMLADPYFRRPPPKSTGRDRFNLAWLRARRAGRHDPKDVQATLAELTARTLSGAIARFCPGAKEAYLCGGGVHNADLVSRIARMLPAVRIASTEELGIHPDWVEATAFAWLAQRALRRETGSLPAVTGARGARVLGAIYPA
jgi:anhydro-N-acetylmuramic acid kinase